MPSSRQAGARLVLTLNAGSSSLKAAVYALEATETLRAAASVDRIGLPGARLRITDAVGRPTGERPLDAGDHGAALGAVLGWIDERPDLRAIDAVAHRVVHGGDFTAPQRITPDVLNALRRLVPVDPEHLPQTLAAIDAIAARHPDMPQFACFDTAFHRSMAPVARMYPLPARYRDLGVRRYGFHGLSCEYIVAALRAMSPAEADGRLIVAHLGNGASMTAVHRGASVDTTMGFSPTGGLMMGTRSGDLDPGVLLYALREVHLTPDALGRLVNREAGLLGVSGTSPDMRDLLAREATDAGAAAAIALFCYLAGKALGGLMVVLGGLDTLVFTGGIGEHSGPIRERIAGSLGPWGVELDAERNAAHRPVVSTHASRVVVRVMQTDEHLVLARHARRLLESGDENRT